MAGDDFFLDIARTHNNIYTGKYIGSYVALFFKNWLKNEFFSGRKRLKKLGLCASGQTIKKLTKRIQSHTHISENVLINIGSVDILQGRDLLDMQQDFFELIDELRYHNLYAVFTTVAPLANCFYQTEVKKKVARFNQFIKKTTENVIDISGCFLNEKGKILYDFYQP